VAALRRLEENGLSGYSGGTAQVFDLLPFSPSYRGAPRRNDETVTQEEGGCQCPLLRTLEFRVGGRLRGVVTIRDPCEARL